MPKRLDELILHSLSAFPNRIAVCGPDRTLTFSELNDSILKATYWLRSLEVGKGDRVGVCLERSVFSIVMFHAVSRLGGIYVPLDNEGPSQLVCDVISDCTPKIVLCDTDKMLQLAGQISEKSKLITVKRDVKGNISWSEIESMSKPTDIRNEVDWNDPAYILYTSGSTGQPKGVCLSHGNAIAFIEWAAKLTNANEDDVFASHASFGFGISVYDIYVPLLSGSKLAIIPESIRNNGAAICTFIADHKINHWYSVPSALLLLIRSQEFKALPSTQFKTIKYAGEPLPNRFANVLRTKFSDSRIFNFYGNTETNVCTYFEIKSELDLSDPPVPIGFPSCGNRVWIEEAEISGVNRQGELVVQGPTVMLGYWGDTFNTERVYRTRDLVRETGDGCFLYIGRVDNVVKIRGHRVEIGEVESHLMRHPDLRDVAVVCVGEIENRKLIAYVVPNDPQSLPTLVGLKEFLAKHLPPYKIISMVHFVQTLPKNINGKIDRKKLKSEAEAA